MGKFQTLGTRIHQELEELVAEAKALQLCLLGLRQGLQPFRRRYNKTLNLKAIYSEVVLEGAW